MSFANVLAYNGRVNSAVVLGSGISPNPNPWADVVGVVPAGPTSTATTTHSAGMYYLRAVIAPAAGATLADFFYTLNVDGAAVMTNFVDAAAMAATRTTTLDHLVYVPGTVSEPQVSCAVSYGSVAGALNLNGGSIEFILVRVC